MKTFLSVVLLLATSAPTATAAEADPARSALDSTRLRRLQTDDPPGMVVDLPQCLVENGFNYAGNDIGSAPGTTAWDCCGSCSAMAGCRAYTWTDFADGTCWFKSGRGTVIADANAKSAIINFSSACQQERDINYVGNDIGSAPATDSTKCCNICSNTPNCRAYTFTSYAGGTCWLKSAKGQMQVSSEATSATPYLEIPTCGLETGVDYVGNDIGSVRASAPGACCSICAGFGGCRAFSWTNTNGGTCWLKNRKDGVARKDGVISGQSAANPPAPSCAMEPGVDYLGGNVGNAPSSDPYGCCSICMKTSGCRAFSWTNYNGGTCWLKSAKGSTASMAGVMSAVI
ncbi:hypothetical protein BBJ28_00008576 [Nothophytophthora sp. Chile5]|nr:hypothetical protein BBJ28_00008576 [Nothophytophthora sp. Chile5]